jgi:HAD superfamily hydrolase (TIGR01509 family)
LCDVTETVRTGNPAAVLWDMDGTLVDTEPYWLAAETELVNSWGGEWTLEDGLQLVGQGLEGSALILRSRGVDLPADEIVALLTDRVLERIRERTPWRPGARELLVALRERGVPTALVTMSIGRMARDIAASLGFRAFDTIVAGDEVEHPKPHPEPYLRAAAELGVDPADCVVLEDSEPGVASGVAAGARVIAVPLHVQLPPSPAYTLWTGGLEGVGPADLAAVPRRVR